ncbi:transposase, partial [Desulfotruncus alcoholivorax]|uniref:transposase n=1 Tax=Desulfotruncus alcoholivorax TaxID=265477 RepID=UPI000558412F
SRFEKDLNELNLQKALSDLCNDLASQVLAIVGSNGEIAIDSTDISAVERPNKESETGASFGHRTASAGETELFYGYKLHLAAVNTTVGPIPVAAKVAPANYSDFEFAEDLMNEVYKMSSY